MTPPASELELALLDNKSKHGVWVCANVIFQDVHSRYSSAYSVQGRCREPIVIMQKFSIDDDACHMLSNF